MSEIVEVEDPLAAIEWLAFYENVDTTNTKGEALERVARNLRQQFRA